MQIRSYFLWPDINPIRKTDKTNYWETSVILTEKIESEINKLYPSFCSVLFPSGRSAIYSIFESLGARRNDYIAMSQYSSHCVIEAAGRLAMPTTDFNCKSKIALLYHQWGYSKQLKQLSAEGQPIIVEDSCDSLVVDERMLFSNNGIYEVFSLPKILGTTFGGVVICKNEKYTLQLKRIRSERNKEVSKVQYWLKNKALEDKAKKIYYEYWEGNEAVNGFLPVPALLQIESYYSQLPYLIEQRKKRLNKINNYDLDILATIDSSKQDRLPVAVPIAVTEQQLTELASNGFQPFIRNFNKSVEVNKSEYLPCFPLPIHQQIADGDFDQMLGVLENAKKRMC